MKNLLQGKRIVLIGGTTGIGLSAAKAFIASGAEIIAVGLDPASCLAAQDSLQEAGYTRQGDATDENTARLAIEQCVEVFGGMDALYHVAGGSGRKWGDGALHELSHDGWNQTLRLNLTSVMFSNRAAVQYFLSSGQAGSILNLSSVLAYAPSPKYFYTHAYAAAKAAIIGFSKSIAAFYAPHNIRINVLAPGLTRTPMAKRAAGDPSIVTFTQTKQPLGGGRMANPGDLDAAAVYFLSDAAGFTTGQILAVDGGWSVSEGQWCKDP